jgi:membrane protease YdiL (CAAX protease family)
MKNLFPGDLIFDWKIVTITVASTLLLIIDRVVTITSWKPFDRIILYLIIPLLFILFVFNERPGEYGFQLGDWRLGLGICFVSLIVILPLLWVFMRFDSTMMDYYRPSLGVAIPLYVFFDLLGWEFLFRGWLTFSYVRKFGPEGLWLQAVPFAIAHISKPPFEVLSTIFGGFAFGWIAWRTRSFLYPLLIHSVIYTFVVLVAGGSPG